MVGSILGNRYEVLERIGTGGMSLVYRARDLTLNRLVAVKILKHQWAEDAEVVRRFDQEARAAASLVDRHVVQVYDVGRDEPDIHYMVMELVAGETLRAKIDREAPLPVEVALDIADQVAQGLEVAHARKLVHRDIKPQNVLISPEGVVKVTDFGIAYAATTGTLVNTGSLLGTVQYLSPEQARGRLIGPQSDLYSLGVVLFEMLTGKLPFESESAIGVAIKHLQDEPARIDELRPDVPKAVGDMVERALSKDPAERYHSAHALRQDIARILHPEAANAGPLPAPLGRREEGPEQPTTPSRRRRWIPWAIVAALVAILAGGGVYAFNRWLNPPIISVPNFKGMALSQARGRAQSMGLSLDVVGHQSSTKVAKNHVLTERPSPGTRIKASQPVDVVVSSGPRKETLPGVTKETLYQAKQELVNTLGLRVRVRHVASSQQSGLVLRQSPGAGTVVAAGSRVTLWVSKGSSTAANVMPNLVGLSVPKAASLLASMNVTIGTPSPMYSTEPPNTIIDQSPAPFSSLQGVTGVSVTTSNGPSPVSSSMPRNRSLVRWTIPSSARPKSLLKVIVTDQAGNEEVYYQQVNPGEPVSYVVIWYGTRGELSASLNGQVEPPRTLLPSNTSSSTSAPSSGTSAPSSGPSPSPSPSPSGGNQ
ncbi:protein kinase [Sulfobacillus sp. DSM 109850]|uniref:non-specific serine/threonine protein kinase n=2 Tax=Sulfobacillus harzensis TaxID=2729629 RepID=A0A7Y0L326_9FIRM|nr:protein kinase [Sulfobacillus harzensis]